jgi:signal transduction histidine kinase
MKRSISITTRTALLAWLVAIGTLCIFALAVIPEESRIFQENLRSKAYGTTVSLRDLAASAVVNEDYSSVVDHCTEMLNGDASIDYIVLTRNDGFSLVHERAGWRSLGLSGEWLPAEREAQGGIGFVPLFNRRVYHFSEPFDYSGIKWGWMHIGLSLQAYDQSVTGLYRRVALLALVCTILGLVASVFYARRLVRPILNLQRVVQRVADGDLSARAQAARGDEIGQLATSVNSMTEALLLRDRTLKEANETLEQRVAERTRELQDQIAARESAHRDLQEAQRRLMQLAREAGMAEVATGVLHNVGNVLTSINVSANILCDTLTNWPRLNLLKQTTDLMRAQGSALGRFLSEDPRGKLVPTFIIELTDQIVATSASSAKEMGHLLENVDHIKQIVATQQNFAKSGGVIQSIAPADLFDEAIRIAKASISRHAVVVTQDLATVEKIETDRHQVLQILVNFITNAIQAVKGRPAGERRISLELAKIADGVQFSVVDNGVGITEEDLQKIFQHGFTTRKDGHGFGLHAGALTARSLGGRLDVHSDGPDRGARFTLTLQTSRTNPPGSTPAAIDATVNPCVRDKNAG